MSDNPSFVLKGILDVEIQQKPVPESESIFGHGYFTLAKSPYLVKLTPMKSLWK
jgi:hypothetical protein